MKKFSVATLVALAALVLAAPAAFAQGKPAAPKKVLSQAFVDKLVSELPAVASELEALGENLEQEFGAASGSGPANAGQVAAALAANSKVKAVLARHGLSDNFWELYVAAMMGYTALAMEEAAAEAEKSQPGSAAMFKDMVDQTKAAVHPDDLALVRKNKDRLAKLFEDLQ